MLHNTTYKNLERIIACGLEGLEGGVNTKETVQENILRYTRVNFIPRNRRIRETLKKLLKAAVLVAACMVLLVSLGSIFKGLVFGGLPSALAILIEATVLADIVIQSVKTKRR